MDRRIASLLALLALTACGGDGGGVQPPAHADVSGTWMYTAPTLVGSFGVECTVTGIVATVTQTGTSFSGSTEGGQWACESLLGDLPPTDLDMQPLRNGIVDGNDVTFEIDGLGGLVLFRHMGTVSGNTMSGALTGEGTVEPIGPVSFEGEWRATR